ncbi:MAG: extracellular solute-binding protein [Firmicutes bacterium]|nr:extracellular solute-binding protein [Bacillota bacterium]
MEGRWAPQLNYCIEQTGINLEVVHIPHGSYSERMLLLELVGDTPDLVIIPPERIAAIVNAGLLMDVQPLVERDLDDLDMWFPPAIRATQFQGITFGLPAYVVNYTYAYNKNIFNERGITPPAIDEWLTWEQVYENARKANEDRDGDGVPEIWGFYNGTNFVQTLAMIRQAGGEVFTEDGFVQFNSPPVHEAVDFLLELVDAKLHPDSQYLFNEGRLASIRLGSGSLVVDRTDDDPTPIGVGAGIMNVRKADVAYFTSWAIPRSSSKPEAAWEFMKCMVTPEAQWYVTERGVVPMRRDVEIAPKRYEMLMGLMHNVEYAESYPYHVESEYVMSAFDTSMRTVWNKTESAATVLQRLDETLNGYLAQTMNQ